MAIKKDRSLEQYKRVGAKMRLVKTLLTSLAVDVGATETKKECLKLLRAKDIVDTVCCEMDSHMFERHPKAGSDYTSVFYGTLNIEPRDEVDAEVIELARSITNGLFER